MVRDQSGAPLAVNASISPPALPMYKLPLGPITGLTPGATLPSGRTNIGDTAGGVSSKMKPELLASLWANRHCCALTSGAKLDSAPAIARFTAITRTPFVVEFFFMALLLFFEARSAKKICGRVEKELSTRKIDHF